jgi:hypothetical protein
MRAARSTGGTIAALGRSPLSGCQSWLRMTQMGDSMAGEL